MGHSQANENIIASFFSIPSIAYRIPPFFRHPDSRTPPVTLELGKKAVRGQPRSGLFHFESSYKEKTP
jgi:hypothetical protein